ncbi:MAG: radical SAM protein [Ruminiclostridium sp.]|nr:radical SAM protein [Ruminiclostridium sp.]
MSLCTLCPRNCRVDRKITAGACSVKGLKIAKAALHFGEEPCISGTDNKGSGTIFFSGCSLKCIFCQNMPISRDGYGKEITADRLGEICLELQAKGAHNINLVTPTHYADIIAAVLRKIKPQLAIPIVYNCGGYEKAETLRELDGLIDIYLPDFKYASSELAEKYSSAPDYPEIAQKAIAEMYRQRGKAVFDDNGMMKSGVLVRHLVLPGCRHDSMRVLDILSETVDPEDIRISLMRQYTPCGKALLDKNLSRRLTTFEYDSVTDYAAKLGFDGYTQEKSSATFEYTPDWDLEGV